MTCFDGPMKMDNQNDLDPRNGYDAGTQDAIRAERNDATPHEAPAESPAQWQPERHRFGGVMILTAAVAGALLALYAWRLPPFGLDEVYTNNAYVRGNVTVVSPRVGGYVQKVLVKDFDEVKAGQPLVEIDPAPFRAKIAQAKAGIAAQQAALNKTSQDRVSALQAVAPARAALGNAQAQHSRAAREWQRIRGVSAEAMAPSSRDAARAALRAAEAAVAQAKAQLAIAEQNVINAGVGREGAEAAIASAEAMLDLAQQDMAHTVVHSPDDGRLGEVAVKNGQLVGSGTQLMSVVPAARWVIANIKETDMKDVRIGQPVRVTVDALGGQSFAGRVAEISPATASEFSIIKADSGTGNFVKVAQRMAVKVTLDPDQQELKRLAPGMSVEVRVDTKQKGHGR